MFTRGEWIAMCVAALGPMKWFGEMVFRNREKDVTHDNAQDGKLAQLEIQLRVHEAEDRQLFTWIKDSLIRIEHRLDNAQSQLRFVAKEKLEKEN